jgi:tetratricopeptide (TPR) repeat protein
MDAMQRGQTGDAETLFAQAVDICPLSEAMRCHYAESLWRNGAHEAAIAHMEEATRMSGGNPDLMIRLGEMYLAKGDLDRAGRQAELAIQANGKLPAAWALQGDVLRHKGLSGESLASYHRALSYSPYYPPVQRSIAETYLAQKRPSRALATLQSLAAGYPAGEVPQDVWFLQGLAQKELGRYDGAVDSFVAAAKSGPQSPEILYHLAESQWLAGDPVNAALTAQAALALDPNYRPMLELRTRLASFQRRLAASPQRSSGRFE